MDEGDTRGATEALAHLTPATFPLGTLAPLLARVRSELLVGRGFVLLRGLPVERYSPLRTAAMRSDRGLEENGRRVRPARFASSSP